MANKYEFATEYILKECGQLAWWQLSKKWKRIVAERIARVIIEEYIESHLTPLALDAATQPPAEADSKSDIIPAGKVDSQLRQ